jgi:hypothetical protein
LLHSHKLLLFENAERPHELLDVLPAAIYTTDAKGRITYYNEAARPYGAAGRGSTAINAAVRGGCLV